MTTKDPKFTAVYVPIKVDAFVNYANPKNIVANQDPRNPRAYLSPIPQPDYNALKLESSFIQHDIFDQTRERPPNSNGDPARQTWERSGIYVHWSLPRTYRTGLTASDGVEDFDQIRAKGGYPPASEQSSSDGNPIFRSVPDRWIVCRQIDVTDDGNLLVHTPNYNGGWFEGPYSPQDDDNRNMGRTYWVVESNTVRKMSDIPYSEDVEVTTSPFVDDSLLPSEQGQSLLGKTTHVQQWAGDIAASDRKTVPLTVNRTTNPFFTDFQPQNSSVFSFFDDLTVSMSNIKWQFCSAKVSYTVMGYHSDIRNDPLYGPIDTQSADERMRACSLQFDPPDRYPDPSAANQIKSIGGLRTFCHGSIFDCRVDNVSVIGDGDHKDHLDYPGDDIQIQFTTSHPLSVGTNDMDAIFGWLRSQNDDQSDLRANLLKLQSFILDQNDDLDSQLTAEDMLATNNFISSPGGAIWHFATPEKQSDGNASADSPPWVPDHDEANRLTALNNNQALLDAKVREEAVLKNQMFDLFWKLVADQGKANTTLSQDAMKGICNNLRNRLNDNISDLSTGQNSLKTAIKDLVEGFTATGRPVQSVAGPTFSIQQDPTVMISGMAPDWPKNINEDLKCRCDDQIGTPFDSNVAEEFSLFFNKVDNSLATPFHRIFMEALHLQKNQIDVSQYPNYIAPIYYPNDDRFKSNGWFPLFIEWEVEYYHLPWESWEFKPCGPESRFGYCIRDDEDLSLHPDLQRDYRVISGRTPILPQAAASLEATLRQVYSKINPDELNQIIDEPARLNLLTEVQSLDYLSTPMFGFTDQLITRVQGTHFTPLRRDPVTGQTTPDQASLDFAKQAIQMEAQDFLDMNTASTTTPFASLTSLPTNTSSISPFKPCTHGQFRFTKLNIMDKFGQVVNGIRTTLDIQGNKNQSPLFPCLGESYSVEESPSKAGTANIIIPRADGYNPFVQLPPSINQPARLNASFMTPQVGKGWRHIEEYENPVRGWLVIDYANTSIQIFSTDGIFVREYSVVTGKVTGLPFPANADVTVSLDPLLKVLLDQFLKDGWLLRFFQNLTRTIDATQSSPSHYAESMLSILGKPLALVTFGYSIELAQPPLTNQSTIPTLSQSPQQSVTDYVFSVKIGDKDNTFDGLFGLFAGDWASFDPSTFLSYHDPDVSKQPPLCPAKAFYADPSQRPDYIDATDSCLNPRLAIVDPFSPVNFYTALLPIRQLSIPSWCLSNGLSRIASFFKTGPTLIAIDVPSFDPSKNVSEDYRLDDPAMPATNGNIPVPSVNMAEFKWLQPYQEDGETKYNAMGILSPSDKPLWQMPPYVVTEGYLQMAKPFVAPNQGNAKEYAT